MSAARPRVAVTRAGLPGDLGPLAAVADLAVWREAETGPDRAALCTLAAGARALLCVNGDPVDDAFLAACPDLELVAIASVGYDSVDAEAAARRGVAVTNTPGVLAEATADLAFGLALAARRRIVEADRLVRAGGWTAASLHLLVGLDVHGATLGIVGYGEIGRAVARRATGFGMRVVHHGRRQADDALSTWLPLDELLATSDIVSLHTPLTAQTRGLIGARELALMKPTATLVNTARGAVVDEAALVEALRAGRLGSAGLDVQVLEPNPDPAHPLLGLPQCVVLPHIGSASVASRAGMIGLAVANVVAHLAGDPLPTPVPGS